ncbi:MAG: tyrosine-type recombinase/integrase [Oligoflexales bacterium]
MRKRRDREEPMIHKSQYGGYRVRFFDQVKGKLREKTCRTKGDAEYLKRAIMRGDDLSLWFPDKVTANTPRDFAALADKWMEHDKHVRRLSHACLKNYESHLRNHILPILGPVQLRDLTIDHIEELARALRRKTAKTRSYTAIRKNRWEDSGDEISLGYQKEILTTTCMVTSWASKRRPSLIRENPFEGFKLPASPEHAYDYWGLEDEDKFFEWIEAGAFYEKVTTRYRNAGKSQYSMRLQLRNHEELGDIVMIALRTGMRLGEIGGLRNADVDLSAGFILVRGSYCRKERKRKNTTKNKKARRIELNDDVREILVKRKHIPQMEHLFNIEINCIKFFSRTCRWAGVKEIHFHSLRHTCLTNLANGYGMVKPLPLPKVQQIAGHSDIKTTMRYVHNDIIQDTASLQWSRDERLRMKESESSHSEQRHSELVEESPGKGTGLRGGSLHSDFVSSRDDTLTKGGLRLVTSSGKNT